MLGKKGRLWDNDSLPQVRCQLEITPIDRTRMMDVPAFESKDVSQVNLFLPTSDNDHRALINRRLWLPNEFFLLMRRPPANQRKTRNEWFLSDCQGAKRFDELQLRSMWLSTCGSHLTSWIDFNEWCARFKIMRISHDTTFGSHSTRPRGTTQINQVIARCKCVRWAGLSRWHRSEQYDWDLPVCEICSWSLFLFLSGFN